MTKQIFPAAVALAIFAASCGQTAQNNEQTAEAPAEEQAAAPAEEATYSVDAAASSIAWKGAKVAYDHSGTVNISEGELVLNGTEITGGSFAIDMTSIVNGDIEDPEKNGMLVGHLKSPDFFAVDSFPQANLEITGVAEGQVNGKLTIKGITNDVTFPANVTVGEDGSVNATADIQIDRTKWDIQFNSGSFFENLGDKLIKDEIDLSVQLAGTKKM